MELSIEQLVLLGFVATLLAQGYKLLYAKLGVDISRKVTTIVVVIVSVVLAYFWLKPTLSGLSDPMQFATELLAVAGAVVGFATLIYNFLMEKVFEKVGLSKSRYIKP